MLKEEVVIDKLILVLPTVVAAMVGYISWTKKNSHQRFIKDLKESLEYTISPIYHDLRHIKKIKNAELREKEILSFFLKYSNQDTTIFKVGSLFLLNWFYEIEELFYRFKNSRYEDDWKIFYYKFEKFYTMIENEYFEACSIQFIEYRWIRSLNSSNMWIRLYKEIIKFLYELFKVLVIILFLSLYFIIALKISKDVDLSFLIEYKETILYIIGAIMMIFAVLISLNSEYLSIYSMQKRDGIIKKFLKRKLKKKIPKIYNWWEGHTEKKLEKYRNYPAMYEIKDSDVFILKKDSGDNVS